MKLVNKTASLQAFVPEYENQAIIFTGDALGSDRAMIAVLLYIVIAIMAFVFAVTTSNTIAKEAGVIGTLRASGRRPRRKGRCDGLYEACQQNGVLAGFCARI